MKKKWNHKSPSINVLDPIFEKDREQCLLRIACTSTGETNSAILQSGYSPIFVA